MWLDRRSSPASQHSSQAPGLPPLYILAAMRVWAVSDIHTDYAQNLQWVRELADSAGGDCRGDVLLVAGDVSDSTETLEKTLSLLAGAFGHVFFVPGNHGEEGGDSGGRLVLGLVVERGTPWD